MSSVADTVARNVQRVRDQIANAAKKSGRAADEITLVAVTKYVDAATARLVVDAGCHVLGESRPQQLWEKAVALADFQRQKGFVWHLIGHLQRNKVARTLPLVGLLHSVDSERLIAEIDKVANANAIQAALLLEVNISGDEAKHGWRPVEMPQVLESLGGYDHIRVQGLMAMAGLDTDADAARREFAALADLKDKLAPLCPANCEMKELSMGMSRDFTIAIEEGATMVRVGSTLLEGLDERFDVGP
jgi:pyridoxal phosphate enzyme (YggS family)